MLSPDHVNKLIGIRLRSRREAYGLSQEELAQKIDVSPADMRLFEQGKKRIPAGALAEAGVVLKVDIDWFFESAPSLEASHENNLSPETLRFLALPEADELIKSFLALKAEDERHLVIQYASRLTPRRPKARAH